MPVADRIGSEVALSSAFCPMYYSPVVACPATLSSSTRSSCSSSFFVAALGLLGTSAILPTQLLSAVLHPLAAPQGPPRVHYLPNVHGAVHASATKLSAARKGMPSFRKRTRFRVLLPPRPLTPALDPDTKREYQRATQPTAHAFFDLRAYDFTRPTSEMYATQAVEWAPAYAEVRRRLDYSWHPYYTLKRQYFQDELVAQVFSFASRERPARPWIIFTAGPMAVGKGHVMQYLEQRGLLNLQDFVQSLPDWFREQLPEYDGYLAHDPQKAGILTQREAGLLSEIVIGEALRLGLNLVVDGSLRDVEFHRQYFQYLREAFPAYRIAIIYVVADATKIQQRAELRAARTGRHIPPDVLLKCIEEVPKSVQTLAALADFVCELDNSDDKPLLLAEGLCKGGGCSYDTFPQELQVPALRRQTNATSRHLLQAA